MRILKKAQVMEIAGRYSRCLFAVAYLERNGYTYLVKRDTGTPENKIGETLCRIPKNAHLKWFNAEYVDFPFINIALYKLNIK